MRDLGIVRGNKESAQPFTIGVDTVFLRFDIEPVPAEDNEMEAADIYEWREFQLSLHEWLAILTAEMVDVNSFALTGQGLLEAVQTVEAAPLRGAEMAVSLATDLETKPFTFKTRFSLRRT